MHMLKYLSIDYWNSLKNKTDGERDGEKYDTASIIKC